MRCGAEPAYGLRVQAAVALVLTLACRPAATTAPEPTPPSDDPPAPSDVEPAPDPAPAATNLETEAAEARALCEGLQSDHDDAPLLACAFLPGGQPLEGGGRVDLLELRLQDPTHAELTLAYLVLRTPADTKLEQLGEAYEIPGESTHYELGELTIDGDAIVLQWSTTSDYFPKTGDGAHASTPEYSETAKFETRCSIAEAYCVREFRD